MRKSSKGLCFIAFLAAASIFSFFQSGQADPRLALPLSSGWLAAAAVLVFILATEK